MSKNQQKLEKANNTLSSSKKQISTAQKECENYQREYSCSTIYLGVFWLGEGFSSDSGASVWRQEKTDYSGWVPVYVQR